MKMHLVTGDVGGGSPISILILSFLIGCATTTKTMDDVLIIERRSSHVDWDDLFMEYNRYLAPDHLVQQINLTLEIISFNKEGLLTIELCEKWRDERLRFIGTERVTVPSNVLPWTPDTYVRNSLKSEVNQRSLTMINDGTFSLKQKLSILLDAEQLPRTLIIGSFDNYGTNLTKYHIELDNVHVASSTSSSASEFNMIQLRNEERRSFDDVIFEDVIVVMSNKSSESH